MLEQNNIEEARRRRPAPPRPAWIWLMIIIVACLLLAGIGWILWTLKCSLTKPLSGGDLSTVRTIFVVLDLTESMHRQPNGMKGTDKSKIPPEPGLSDYQKEIKEIVKSQILPQLGPGDFIECYQIDSDSQSFAESKNQVFGGARSRPPLPEVREGIADGRIKPDDFAKKCAKGPEFKEELKQQWATLDTLRNSWINRIDSAPPPADRCCSAYLAAMDYIGRRLSSDQVKGEKWLIIVGDLLEESRTRTASSYTNPKALPALAAEPEEKERDRLRGVKVLLIRPSGPQDIRLRNILDDLWREYFQSRGARNIQFFSFNSQSGLSKTNVPRLED
jgi:hypothetical protein